MENKKSYYSIIPANVRYDNELTPNAKLLYSEITALSNEKGYCWASNSYFADLYNVSIKSISRWISLLNKKGYINIEFQYKTNSKEVEHRFLTLLQDPLDKNVHTPRQKCPYPLDKNVQDNTKLNTKKNNTSFLEEDEQELCFFGFPLPKGWREENYGFESDGSEMPNIVVFDEFGMKVSLSRIKRLKQQFQASQRVSDTPPKPTKKVIAKIQDTFANESVKILQEKIGGYKLDGKDNKKHALELKGKFLTHLKQDMKYEPTNDNETLSQFRFFLDKAMQHNFHGPNITNMAYLNKHFVKIIRSIK